MNNGRASNFITGFLIGGVIGSAFTFLYTPIKGKKLRKKLAQKTNNVMDDVNEYIHVGKDKANDIYKTSMKKADYLIDHAKKLVS